MKTRPFYLVIDTNQPRPAVVRSRQSWPQLEPGEIVVRMTLEIPDSAMPNIQEIVIDDVDSMRYAVEPEPIEA